MPATKKDEMIVCEVCGERYSSTYRDCPFCQEAEAEEDGVPIRPRRREAADRGGRRSKGSSNAMGVLALLAAVVLLLSGDRKSVV